MRKITFSLTVILASLFFVACSSADSTNKESKKEEKKVEVLAENKSAVKMEIDGMVCAMGCAKYIEDKVADLDGILSSKVDFEAGLADFEFDKSAMTAEEIQTFISEIHDGQYKATLVAEQEKEVKTEKVEVESTSPSKDSKKENPISSVREKLDINFPELLTYFLKQLR